MNPFTSRAARARAAYEKASRPSARDAAMANAFPLGAGFGRKGDARRVDRSIDRGVKAAGLLKTAEHLEALAGAFDRGEVNVQGRAWSSAKQARSDKAADARARRSDRIEKARALRADRPAWRVPVIVWADSTGFLAGGARRLVESEHREAVEQALARGEQVPAEVLEAYPDLKA